MKKLALLLGIVFCSNLFAAAAADDVQAARQIKGRIKPPAKDDVLIQTPFTWRMTGVTAADENKDHLAAFLAIMKNHVAIKIEQMNPPLLLEALTHLNSIRFRLLNLTDLDLSENQNFSSPLLEEMLKKISHLAPNLNTLKVSNCDFRDEQARIISQTIPHLTTLDISENHIGPAGAAYISRMTDLTDLDIWCNRIGDAGAASISQMPHLRILDIYDNDIGPAGAASTSAMTNLTNLDIGCNNIGPEGASSISGMGNLTDLGIHYNHIGPSGRALLREKLPNTLIVF